MAMKLDYSGIVRLMTYLPHEEVLGRNGETWFRWKDYYFCRMGNGETYIRKGSYRRSATIFYHRLFVDYGIWYSEPDKDLVKLIEDAYDYWDLHIG